MAKKLFITATNTNIGKTYSACKILESLGKQGIKIGAVKPIETGVVNTPQDASKLLNICKKYNPNFKNLTPQDICAYTFTLPSAPFSADTKGAIEVNKIIDKVKEISKLCNYLIIEGAGGLYVPIKKDFFMIDLIATLNIQTLLITHDKLGCINDTLLSINALKNRDIEFNWCVNFFENKKSFNKTTKDFYDSYFDKWYSLNDILKTNLLRG